MSINVPSRVRQFVDWNWHFYVAVWSILITIQQILVRILNFHHAFKPKQFIAVKIPEMPELQYCWNKCCQLYYDWLMTFSRKLIDLLQTFGLFCDSKDMQRALWWMWYLKPRSKISRINHHFPLFKTFNLGRCCVRPYFRVKIDIFLSRFVLVTYSLLRYKRNKNKFDECILLTCSKFTDIEQNGINAIILSNFRDSFTVRLLQFILYEGCIKNYAIFIRWITCYIMNFGLIIVDYTHTITTSNWIDHDNKLAHTHSNRIYERFDSR